MHSFILTAFAYKFPFTFNASLVCLHSQLHLVTFCLMVVVINITTFPLLVGLLHA